MQSPSLTFALPSAISIALTGQLPTQVSQPTHFSLSTFAAIFTISLKAFSDNMVVEFVKLLLKPTGKTVKYLSKLPEDAPEGLTTLNDFVSDFNRRVKTEERRRLE